MKFNPLNRHVLIRLLAIDDEPAEEATILLPDGYKPKNNTYDVAVVIRAAPDCKIKLNTLDNVVVQSSMIEKIEFGGEQLQVILENYIMGTIDE
tara:strand:- start:1506 stop:1787 length:282 start_codon:yes stop_codon:yes gene_type:complete